jgi:hypothetical protein
MYVGQYGYMATPTMSAVIRRRKLYGGSHSPLESAATLEGQDAPQFASDDEASA